MLIMWISPWQWASTPPSLVCCSCSAWWPPLWLVRSWTGSWRNVTTARGKRKPAASESSRLLSPLCVYCPRHHCCICLSVYFNTKMWPLVHPNLSSPLKGGENEKEQRQKDPESDQCHASLHPHKSALGGFWDHMLDSQSEATGEF